MVLNPKTYGETFSLCTSEHHTWREIAQMYNELLANTSLVLPKEVSWGRHVYYLYVVRHPERDRIISQLRQEGIYLNISYPTPIHLMDAYRHLANGEGALPNTELASREIFSLPMFPDCSPLLT